MVIKRLVGTVDERQRRRRYRSRVNALPTSHREAVRAWERYLGYIGALTAGSLPSGVFLSMLEEFVESVERAAAARRPIRAVVGDDPVGAVEALLRSHTDAAPWRDGPLDPSVSAVERRVHDDIGRGLAKERRRLVEAVAGSDSGSLAGRP